MHGHKRRLKKDGSPLAGRLGLDGGLLVQGQLVIEPQLEVGHARQEALHQDLARDVAPQHGAWNRAPQGSGNRKFLEHTPTAGLLLTFSVLGSITGVLYCFSSFDLHQLGQGQSADKFQRSLLTEEHNSGRG